MNTENNDEELKDFASRVSMNAAFRQAELEDRWSDGYRQGKADERKKGLRIVALMMIIIAVLSSLLATSQDTTIRAELPDNYYFADSDTVRIYKIEWIPSVQQDTIPVTILVRIQGRPWAFFHDGWEVKKHRQLDQSGWIQGPVGVVYARDGKYYDEMHVGYLDSRKRPIRKEWVVYDKYSRNN